MKNLLNSIQLTKPKSNVFDLTHDVKLSCNIGQLVPIMALEAVPGDKFNIGCESLIRFMPMVAPVMHRMDVTMHYFFVPNRVLWDGWESWITGTNALDPAPRDFPIVTMDSTKWGKLSDYLGIPEPIGVNSEEISALPFAAYQLIYNEYYRDQNLIAPVNYLLDNGDNAGNADLFVLRKRAWEHDYFTAALPTAQMGSTVAIPLGSVELNPTWAADGSTPFFTLPAGSGVAGGPANITQDTTPAPTHIEMSTVANTKNAYDPDGSLEVGSTTINDLRRAFRLQEWLEKSARGGKRYIENILIHFGVRSSDKRLQRPEYITGIKTPVVISEVLNTSATEASPQGSMAGHGLAYVSGKYGNYFCEEHGYIIGIMSVMPKTAYQQGIPKHFTKTHDPYEHFWPSFANIGEQAVLNKEIYAYQAAGAGENTFGYVPRYAEYKFEANRVAGQFRDTLDFWHLGRIFASPPALNSTFIQVDSLTTDRIFAVTDPAEDKLIVQVVNKVRAVRRMPKFGTPQF